MRVAQRLRVSAWLHKAALGVFRDSSDAGSSGV